MIVKLLCNKVKYIFHSNRIMDEFQENIKKWVTMDNNIKTATEELKNMKIERSEISDTILDFVETENLNSTTININNGTLKFGTVKQSNGLTLTYVKSCLEQCISNEDDVNSIMDVIKSSREVKVSSEIKRSYEK
ncbi:hypothetical protein CL646_05545 [bacterium]|nr:hypothetical protein [bacterium]